jgi:putative transposase
MSAQAGKLYHLGIKPFGRSTLAKAHETQPNQMCEVLFQHLLVCCQGFAPKKRFRFKAKLYLLDASMIDPTSSLYPWTKYRKSKGAAKLHIGLDVDGYLSAFVSLTEGKEHEINMARELELPKGSYIVFDRGYTDYAWYQELSEVDIRFVTRLKRNAVTIPSPKRRGRKSPAFYRISRFNSRVSPGLTERLCIWMRRSISPTSF